MHPLHIEQTARMVAEQRLQQATENRRVRALVGRRRAPRERVGAAMVAIGTRLQGRPVGRPRTASPC